MRRNIKFLPEISCFIFPLHVFRYNSSAKCLSLPVSYYQLYTAGYQLLVSHHSLHIQCFSYMLLATIFLSQLYYQQFRATTFPSDFFLLMFNNTSCPKSLSPYMFLTPPYLREFYHCQSSASSSPLHVLPHQPPTSTLLILLFIYQFTKKLFSCIFFATYALLHV